MKFSEKLDLLMNITNTTNSSLARCVSLDASFISRLRLGTRKPAKKENYLKLMAAYFVRNCSSEYQKNALNKALQISSEAPISDSGEMTERVYQWLATGKGNEAESIEHFLNGISQFSFKKTSQMKSADILELSEATVVEDGVFYGTEGKQQAVLAFLTLVIKNEIPQQLLLYSDEDFSWLTDNREFTAKWAMLLSQVILRGNRIKIIHTVNRSLDEMLTAIEEWLPIYMTGMIEPYYYPKARDGVFRRTLFIAPQTAAVTSSSVGNNMAKAANFLTTERTTIAALTGEFNDYLTLCRPLMKIFTPLHKKEYYAAFAEFENEQANEIMKTESLSGYTMPIEVVQSIFTRIAKTKQEPVFSYCKRRAETFEQRIQHHIFTEIIPYPDIEAIKRGTLPVSLADMIGCPDLFYQPEEYGRHLENVIGCLQTYDNYQVSLLSRKEKAGYLLYVKEEVGVLVAKTTQPSVIFAINERNMTGALWNYMSVQVNYPGREKEQKERTIAELKNILKKLHE